MQRSMRRTCHLQNLRSFPSLILQKHGWQFTAGPQFFEMIILPNFVKGDQKPFNGWQSAHFLWSKWLEKLSSNCWAYEAWRVIRIQGKSGHKQAMTWACFWHFVWDVIRKPLNHFSHIQFLAGQHYVTQLSIESQLQICSELEELLGPNFLKW